MVWRWRILGRNVGKKSVLKKLGKEGGPGFRGEMIGGLSPASSLKREKKEIDSYVRGKLFETNKL